MAQRRNTDRCEADRYAPDALAEMSSGFLKAYAAWRVSSKMMRSYGKAYVAPCTAKVYCMLSQSSVLCEKKKMHALQPILQLQHILLADGLPNLAA
jgi:hypothetical protein